MFGVPMIWIIVDWGLYWGPHILGSYKMAFVTYNPNLRGNPYPHRGKTARFRGFGFRVKVEGLGHSLTRDLHTCNTHE